MPIREKGVSSTGNCSMGAEQKRVVKELLKWALHSDPEHDEDFDQKMGRSRTILKVRVKD